MVLMRSLLKWLTLLLVIILILLVGAIVIEKNDPGSVEAFLSPLLQSDKPETFEDYTKERNIAISKEYIDQLIEVGNLPKDPQALLVGPWAVYDTSTDELESVFYFGDNGSISMHSNVIRPDISFYYEVDWTKNPATLIISGNNGTIHMYINFMDDNNIAAILNLEGILNDASEDSREVTEELFRTTIINSTVQLKRITEDMYDNAQVKYDEYWSSHLE